ncbi:hypothetical protein DFP72DRAFT_973400, partial [Ephemerocybe angulata]
MERPPSTFRTLIPFTTSGPTASLLQTGIPGEWGFQPFIEKLNDFDRHPEKYPAWGVYKPQEFLHDDGFEAMPRVKAHRIQGGKHSLPVVEGLAMYTTALKVVDALCTVKGVQGEGVLEHEKQGYWVGKSMYIDALSDLKAGIQNFLSYAQALIVFHAPITAHAVCDPSLKLADEIANTYYGRKALCVVRNLATVAFSLSVMKKGYIQVPDNVNDLQIDSNGFSTANIEVLMAKPKRIRQALHLAANISPLTVILCGDLTKDTVCLEELLINMKLFGNTKPQLIRQLEQDIWERLFDIAQGKTSAYGAFTALLENWRARDVVGKIEDAESSYFMRENERLYTSDMSPYDAYLRPPFPLEALPPAALPYLRPKQVPDTDDETEVPNKDPAEPLAGGEEDEEERRRTSRRLAEKKTEVRKTPVPNPERKSYSRRRRAPKSSAMVEERDLADEEGESEVEIMDWWDWESAPFEARVKLEEELVETLEEVDDFVTSSAYGLKPPVNIDEVTEKYSDSQEREFEMVDGLGQLHQKKWFFHNKEDYDAWESICERAQRPAHIFHCMTYDEYKVLAPSKLQAIFAEKNIVVTGTPGIDVCFDLAGLETLADRHQRIELQDQSVPITDGNFATRARTAIVQDLYDCHKAPREKKKSLNALSFPNPDAGIVPTPYASDVRAVQRTRLDPGCISALPTGDIRWGLAATEGAHSYWHIDTQGEGTSLRISRGQKGWFAAEPKVKADLGSTMFWTDQMLDVMKLSLNDYDVEGVILNPGDMLLMRGNTIHCAYTLEDSICHGGYFLSSACLSRTVCGAVHTFFESRVATNTDGPAFVGRVNSLAAFYHKCIALQDAVDEDDAHLPNVGTVDGLTNLLVFACGIELLNALSTDSYLPVSDDALVASIAKKDMDPDTALDLYDMSAVAHETRLHNACSRGRMVDLLERIFARYTIVDTEGREQDGWDFLWIPMLAWFIHALKDYH